MNLRFLTAGESHGPCLTAIVEGIPAGLRIDLEAINKELARRQQGFGRGGRMKIETDRAEILSGVRFGESLGGPITLRVVNRDWENWTDRMAPFGEPAGVKVTEARPGHADLTGIRKYARQDVRDILERSSARETTMRVAVGALCKQLLSVFDVRVASHVLKIGGVAVDESRMDRAHIGHTDSELNCLDAEAEEKMKYRIREAQAMGDTLGGVFEVIAQNVPLGLGSHVQWDRRIDARLSAALMSIQAIKGVEIGAGFRYGEESGSVLHDEIFMNSAGHVYRKTNNAGGIEGGMTNGEELTLRAVMKPIPTLMKPLSTIDIVTKKPVLASKERSDVCAVSAASVVGEAMTAIVLAQMLTEEFGQGALVDMKAAVAAYKARVESDW